MTAYTYEHTYCPVCLHESGAPEAGNEDADFNCQRCWQPLVVVQRDGRLVVDNPFCSEQLAADAEARR